MPIFLFFIILWYLSLFAQTFLQHRYAAHGAFTMSKPWERFFYVFAYIVQGSSYMSPRSYAIMHRLHHAYTDTEKDPHSPQHSSNLFTMMWKARNYYRNIYLDKMEVDNKFTKNLPDWPALDKFAHSLFSRLLWIGIYIGIFIWLSPSAWWYLLLPFVITMGPLHGTIVNWFAHKYGYINFNLKNSSQNLFSVDILMLGESYHNNHHRHPSAINFGSKWHELDPVYPVILLFNWLHIIQIKHIETAQPPRMRTIPDVSV